LELVFRNEEEINMSLTVYVTGCLGFIGAYVTEACLNQGWHVIGVDKMTYASQPDKLEYFKGWGPNHFKFIESDINDLDRLYDCDYIINCAAETHVDNSIVSSKEFLRSNVNGVHHLLELVRSKERFRIPTLLHFSTDEVYGDITEGSHTEENLLKPSNPYSATKAAADMLILAWNRTFKVPYIIVRPTNNYGIGQYVEKLIPKTCKLLLMGKKIPLHNYGTPTRIWLHAKDTADAVIYIINNKCQNEIYNISGNYEDTNITVASKIINCYIGQDINTPLNEGELNKYLDFSFHRPGVDVRYSLDDSKLQALGWECQKEFDNELPSVVAYYKDKFVW
jgi:dTDP-glucose 4,6-dehydratase